MKTIIKLNIERLEENEQEYFVATSNDVQGLVAEGNTIEEVVNIASDLARLLIELDQQGGLHTRQALPRLPD
jgi:predicted RNase H-like HicB family nuclease